MPAIVIPDDSPTYIAGSPAETRLRALGDLTIFSDEAARDPAELIRRCRDAEIVMNVYGKTKFTDAVLSALPKLKLISRTGTGVDGIDLESCRKHRVAVANLRGNDADEIAEHSLTLMLCALRRIPEMDRGLRQGQWETDYIRGAYGLTLGVVGLGAIGSRMAALGRALGMKVLAWSFGADNGRAAKAGAERAELDDLLQRSDVVSLHLRLSPEARGLIDARRLALMKSDAILVNTARGGLVDRDALIAALSQNRLAAAAVDVFHVEPVPANDALLNLPNVIATPHSGSNMPYVVARGTMTAVANIENWLKGAPTNLVVDPR